MVDEESQGTTVGAPTQAGQPREERLQFFRSRVAKIFATVMQDEESISLRELLTHVNEGLPTDSLFGTSEATEICQIMGDNDELMISEGTVYKV
ncbi:hypothetical protein NMY22_g19803 [Coprinellus aureogranulatus]|nr:hypothetical protein NMY22_g19803 [Coprinellus aureogranulatus]